MERRRQLLRRNDTTTAKARFRAEYGYSVSPLRLQLLPRGPKAFPELFTAADAAILIMEERFSAVRVE
jgi:hypothetical protein